MILKKCAYGSYLRDVKTWAQSQSNHGSGVQRSGDARGEYSIVCPLPGPQPGGRSPP